HKWMIRSSTQKLHYFPHGPLASILSAAVIALHLTGCASYGYDVESEIINIGPSYPPTEALELSFGEYDGAKTYQQLAFIRILGNERSDTAELVEELKREAKVLGADAVINIQTANKERTQRIFTLLDIVPSDDDSSKEKKENNKYEALVLEGVAIKYQEE
ncbi:hypothetical protein, partial [Bacterioplanes sanyensis]|uniref:hypothetical protein n=1 Tax=Bacterioplanes sanyensis TaxID=1249553 RepID=UPI00167BD222